MNEEQYQLGIRDLSLSEAAKVILAYRKQLRKCEELFKKYAQENFADNVWHKVASANNAETIRLITEDYKLAVKWGED